MTRLGVSRSIHIRRDDVPFSFAFHPRPTLHARASLRRRRSGVARASSWPPCVNRAPPRGVTVFADRQNKPALQIRKNSAATSRPPIACGFVCGSLVSPAHAPSRRLQRVSFVLAGVPRGQASRRRPRWSCSDDPGAFTLDDEGADLFARRKLKGVFLLEASDVAPLA